MAPAQFGPSEWRSRVWSSPPVVAVFEALQPPLQEQPLLPRLATQARLRIEHSALDQLEREIAALFSQARELASALAIHCDKLRMALNTLSRTVQGARRYGDAYVVIA